MGLRLTHIDEDLWGQRFHAAAALPGGVLFSQEHDSVFSRAETEVDRRKRLSHLRAINAHRPLSSALKKSLKVR